jgi:predicted HTH domain antitoxin
MDIVGLELMGVSYDHKEDVDACFDEDRKCWFRRSNARMESAEITLGARQRASSDTLEVESEMTVAVDIPDDLERRLRDGWADMPRKVLEAVAVEAYRSGALTGAEVQRLLGLESRWDLEAFLKQAGVVLDYDQADLARDLEVFRQSGS